MEGVTCALFFYEFNARTTTSGAYADNPHLRR